MRFIKMHGCGNDYVYLDGFQDPVPTDLPELARVVADRHCGIGADGLILVAPADDADASMRMWNADGSESEMCGNGLRCAAALACNRGHLPADIARFATGAGILTTTCHRDDDAVCRRVTIAMGRPRLTADGVPAVVDDSQANTISLDHPELPDLGHAVGMGNPHCVLFVTDAETAPVTSLGRVLEHDPRFPNRTNVEFVSPLAAENGLPVLRQRTWERGSGETLACGTGACAVAVAAMRTGIVPVGEVIIRLSGGDLQIAWDGQGEVHMTGPAIAVFAGTWLG